MLEYCESGNLRRVAKEAGGKLSEEQARKYICEIVLAIEYLHSQNILYRDMKPDNILVHSDGHLKLADFGLSKHIEGDSYESKSPVGSYAYLAPEVLNEVPYGKSIDWYQLGVTLHEMLCGITPHYCQDGEQLKRNIIQGQVVIDDRLSTESGDLLYKLLLRNPYKRLGAHEGAPEIKAHPFFEGVNWDDVLHKKVDLP